MKTWTLCRNRNHRVINCLLTVPALQTSRFTPKEFPFMRCTTPQTHFSHCWSELWGADWLSGENIQTEQWEVQVCPYGATCTSPLQHNPVWSWDRSNNGGTLSVSVCVRLMTGICSSGTLKGIRSGGERAASSLVPHSSSNSGLLWEIRAVFKFLREKWALRPSGSQASHISQYWSD